MIWEQNDPFYKPGDLEMGSSDQQQQPLETCWKGSFSSLTRGPTEAEILVGLSSNVCFHKSSQRFGCRLNFENH